MGTEKSFIIPSQAVIRATWSFGAGSLAIPLALFWAETIGATLPARILWLILGLAMVAAYPPQIFRIFMYILRPAWSPAMVMLGAVIRLTTLAVLSLWLRMVHVELLRAGLFLFLAVVGSFLFLEVLGVLGAEWRLRARKDSNEI